MSQKRKAYVTDDEEQRLFRQFCDDLDDDTFFGNSFEKKDYIQFFF